MTINITKNTLSGELVKKLKDFTRDGKPPSGVNFFNWGAQIVQSSNAIFKFVLDEDLKKELSVELIHKGIFNKEPKSWAASIHLMSRHSNIPWHNDSPHKSTCTIYLNEVWNSDWGGYFIYQDDEELKATYPEYNKAVWFECPLNHTVTLTALNAPLRETVQIFVDEE